ncbi:unnamed protein product [Prunus brigantina]
MVLENLPEMLKLRGHSRHNGHIRLYSSYFCSNVISGVFGTTNFSMLSIDAGHHTFVNDITTGEVARRSPFVAAYVLASEGEADRCLTIFIGRGLLDILSLFKVDAGIVVTKGEVDNALMDVATQHGAEFVPLFDSVLQRQQELFGGGSPKWGNEHGIIYEANNFEEVHGFILALKIFPPP